MALWQQSTSTTEVLGPVVCATVVVLTVDQAESFIFSHFNLKSTNCSLGTPKVNMVYDVVFNNCSLHPKTASLVPSSESVKTVTMMTMMTVPSILCMNVVAVCIFFCALKASPLISLFYLYNDNKFWFCWFWHLGLCWAPSLVLV